jgi:uncharacterized protein (TIGR03083 family)
VTRVLDVTPMLRPERALFVELLESLDPEDWDTATECPAYSVKGVATHVLGDDLSLLSRQRDKATNGVLLMAERMAGADFRSILDAFNDQWVAAARFFSTEVTIDLLRMSGERTADFYESVDLDAPCEPVFFFGSTGERSPYWQAIAREFVERWVHHSQIRRALGVGSLADEAFVRTGVEVVAAAANVPSRTSDGRWWIGELEIGDRQQAADLLTRAHRAEEIPDLVAGPSAAVDLAAASFGR